MNKVYINFYLRTLLGLFLFLIVSSCNEKSVQSDEEYELDAESQKAEFYEVLKDFDWDDHSIRSVTFLTSNGKFAITNDDNLTHLPSNGFMVIPGFEVVNKSNVFDVLNNIELISLDDDFPYPDDQYDE